MIACIIVRNDERTAIYVRKGVDVDAIVSEIEKNFNINSLENGMYKVYLDENGEITIKKDDEITEENFEILKDFLSHQ